jgi:hypothetical protein
MIVLLIILCVLAFFLLQPIRVKFSFEEELAFKVYYSIIPVFSYPGVESEEVEKEEEPKDEENKEEEKEDKESPVSKIKRILKQTGLKGFLNIIYELLKIVLSGGYKLIRKIKLTEADIYICTTDENAADAAVGYGKLCTAVYPAVSVLYNFFRCKKGKVTVDVDYDREDSIVKAEGTLRVNLFFAIAIILSIVFKALPKIIKLLKQIKKGKNDERKSEQPTRDNG